MESRYIENRFVLQVVRLSEIFKIYKPLQLTPQCTVDSPDRNLKKSASTISRHNFFQDPQIPQDLHRGKVVKFQKEKKTLKWNLEIFHRIEDYFYMEQKKSKFLIYIC